MHPSGEEETGLEELEDQLTEGIQPVPLSTESEEDEVPAEDDEEVAEDATEQVTRSVSTTMSNEDQSRRAMRAADVKNIVVEALRDVLPGVLEPVRKSIDAVDSRIDSMALDLSEAVADGKAAGEIVEQIKKSIGSQPTPEEKATAEAEAVRKGLESATVVSGQNAVTSGTEVVEKPGEGEGVAVRIKKSLADARELADAGTRVPGLFEFSRAAEAGRLSDEQVEKFESTVVALKGKV